MLKTASAKYENFADAVLNIITETDFTVSDKFPLLLFLLPGQ